MKKAARLLVPVVSGFLILALTLSYSLYNNYRFELNAAKLKGEIGSLKADINARESSISALKGEIENTKEGNLFKELELIKQAISGIKKLKEKVVNFSKLGVNVKDVESQIPSSVDLIIESRFEEASTSANRLSEKLDTLYQQKLEADRKALEEAQRRYEQVVSGTGYVRYNVRTEVGTFNADILVMDMSKVKVITDTASDSECKRDCPLLSLSAFVSRNGGFAGVNGSYYCPPEYPQCVNKKNSFDFPVYNSRLGKWINKKNLFWDNRALITFKGASASFYKYERNYSTGTGVEAGITMVPGLLKDGAVIVGDYSLEPKEKIRSTRSSIGYNGNRVFVVVARGVTNYELAYVHKAVGSKNAIALDGGGSVNFYYNGSYYAGPGRAQANSIIFRYK